MLSSVLTAVDAAEPQALFCRKDASSASVFYDSQWQARFCITRECPYCGETMAASRHDSDLFVCPSLICSTEVKLAPQTVNIIITHHHPHLVQEVICLKP